jgi:hypothetical protein
MGKLTLGDLLRAREKSFELRVPDDTVKRMMEIASRDDDASYAINLVVEFFGKVIDQIEGAILGKDGHSFTLLLGDSNAVKYNYPVARILDVKHWKGYDSLVSFPSHKYYAVWHWFYCWCQGNGLVPYLEPRWTSEEARWYEIGVNPEGD